MHLSLSLGVSMLSFLCVYSGLAQKLDGLKGEVELITEPRPGNEFVQIHTTNGEKSSTRLLKQAGSKFGAPHIYSKSRGLPESERDIPIIPAKDKRLLRLTANQESSQESDNHDMQVSIIDEGKTGFEFENADEEEKKILDHKSQPTSGQQAFEEPQGQEDQEKFIDNVSLYMESKNGIQKSDAIEENDESPVRQLSTFKPLLDKLRDKHTEKKATEKKYDILTFNKQKHSNKKFEDNFDFVDSPFEDKLVSSGTSQTSRINVKKGPNGQDYEYEYVYYYYDEDDENKQGQQQEQPTPEGPKQRLSGRVSTTPEPIQTSWRQQTPVTTIEPSRAESPRTRGRPNDITRYTVSGASLEQDIPTEKISNELLPAVTTPARIRGRPQTTELVPEDSLPEGGRFPSRSRGSTTTPFVSSTPAVASDAPATRTRGNIRRPSLELVDSSSFRTHSSDVSPDQDQNKQTIKSRGEPVPVSHVIHSESFTTQSQNFDQQFQTRPAFTSQRNPIENLIPTETLQDQVPVNRGNSIDSVRPPQEEFRGDRVLETTRESDLEEFIPQTDVPTSGDFNTRPRGQIVTERPVSPLSGNTGMPDKAAFDLYAIMQQIHNEESNYLTEENSAVQLDQNGIPISATAEFPTTSVTSTTTTTTTTSAPTTTSTPIEEVPALPGKRFKNNLAQRNRFKVASSTTTTEVPADQSTLRSRQFTPSKSRPPGQQSAYARRQKTSTISPSEDSSSSTSAPEEFTKPKTRFGSRNRFGTGASTTSTTPSSASSEKPATRAGSSSGFSSRRRQGSRLGAASTASSEGPETSSATPEAAQTSASTPSLRARLPGSAVRPLRPGPRINIGGPRGRLGLSSTTVAPEETKSTSESVSPDGSVSESAPQPQEQHSESEVNAESSPADQPPSTTPDALTRLRNRPRLQSLARPARPQPTVAAATAGTPASTAASSVSNASVASPLPNRRALGGLLGRQRPGITTSTAASPAAVVEEQKAEESAPLSEEESSPSTEATQATTENRISSLISRRRNIAARRPGTIQTRSANKETSS